MGHHSLEKSPEDGSAGKDNVAARPSKAKHDEGKDLPLTSLPSWKENEDEPPLVAVSLPAESAYLVGSRDDLAKSESSTVEGCEGLAFAKQLDWGQWTRELPKPWEDTQPQTQQPHYLHRFCDNCEESICTFNSSPTILCYHCLNTIQKENEMYKDQTRTREGGDDEQEFKFTGIPIAG